MIASGQPNFERLSSVAKRSFVHAHRQRQDFTEAGHPESDDRR
jgi:hypothetical protein